MEEKEISIKVLIGDRHYPLKISSNEEENVRKAAKLVNERSKFYTDNYSVQDKQDAMAMAALEFASENLNVMAKDKSISNEMENLLLDLDQYLSAQESF
ncbi:MAG: cell division protein ZapA [Flavobacteriales bacterium]|nr:cell division protein ZapA [Flavobacteriales bacterium]